MLRPSDIDKQIYHRREDLLPQDPPARGARCPFPTAVTLNLGLVAPDCAAGVNERSNCKQPAGGTPENRQPARLSLSKCGRHSPDRRDSRPSNSPGNCMSPRENPYIRDSRISMPSQRVPVDDIRESRICWLPQAFTTPLTRGWRIAPKALGPKYLSTPRNGTSSAGAKPRDPAPRCV